jgi:hypothetical protein
MNFANENDWNTIINTNLMAPFFLSQSLSAVLSYLVCSKGFYLASCLFVRR